MISITIFRIFFVFCFLQSVIVKAQTSVNTNLFQKPNGVEIVDIKVFHKSILSSDNVSARSKYDSVTHVLHLLYLDNIFSFEFAPIENTSKYAYMLEGFDNEWIIADNFDREATYMNLSGGNYNFKMKLVDSVGNTISNEVNIAVDVDPPFWHSTWFYILLILLLIVAVYFMISSRLQRVVRLRKILEKQIEQKSNELDSKKQELAQQTNLFMEQRDVANIQRTEIARQKEEIEKQREMLEAVVDKRTSDLAVAKEKVSTSEQAKKKSESIYKLIAENARDMIFRLKLPEETFDYVNQATFELTGYSPQEFYDNPTLLRMIVDKKYKDQYLDDYRKALSGDVVPTQEYQINCKDGTSKWICQRSVVTYINGDVDALEAIMFDISERKKAETSYIAAKRRAEEADSLKSSFIETMSHEIRTPMNAIIGFAELLADPNISLDEKTAFVGRINTSSASLIHMVDDLIDLSKIEAGKLEISKSQCYVNIILEELYISFDAIRQENALEDVIIKLTTPNKERNFSIYTDNYRFRQILMNLIGNALKYTYKGEIEFGYDMEVVDSDDSDDGTITFFIKDTGIGMTTQQLEHLFDRYSAANGINEVRIPGSGLGITISKSLVEMLDGKLWVDSKEGIGTTFWFTIPLEKPKGFKKKDQVKEREVGEDWTNKTILIAEDEENNYKFVQAALRKTNVQLLRAKDGSAAVEMFKENKSKIDIILMDIQMPLMNGYEATQIIKQLAPNVPIIAQTAFAMAGGKIKCFEAGCDGYISKPYKAKDLIDALSKYI